MAILPLCTMLYSVFLSQAQAHTGSFHDWPQQFESNNDIAYWVYEDGWYISPERTVSLPGTRLGLFVEKLANQPVSLEARAIIQDVPTPWQSLRQEFTLPTLELWIQDLPAASTSIQFRTQDPSAMEYLEWDIVNPVQENSPQTDAVPPPANTFLSQSLINLGVVSRTSWGARNTTCTSPETDWYRMAIHHVASQQTYNGSIAARLQSIQAWAMDSGGYCDVPYQYLVGYDGTLFEGRPITMYSGATGGGNNDGNIALSFIGCYDQSACQNSFGFYNEATEAMMARAREIIQVLSADHGFAVNTTNIKSHKDWPGNATACPGAYIINRFDELLSSVPPFYGTVGSQSHTATIEIEEGQSVDVWVDITNTGQRNWTSNTRLAPFPRDVASDLTGAEWMSETRVASVNGTVAPGSSYRFAFTLHGNAIGTYTQNFTMVEEWFTWFGDTPYAGSPSDTAISFVVNVVPVATEPSSEPSTENIPPIANAGVDQLVNIGETVSLNGLGSLDPEGSTLLFDWSFVEDTSMDIENSNTGTPSFVATEAGDWEVQMIVFDSQTSSIDSVLISVYDENLGTTEEETKRGCSSHGSVSWMNLGYLVFVLSILSYRQRKQ